MSPKQQEELRSLISSSDSTLITAHISPDGDSVSSSLLAYQILKTNFPQKKFVISMEEAPYGFDFLAGYEKIQFQPLSEALDKVNPDLIFVLDAAATSRLTRWPENINWNGRKVVVIDHHEKNDLLEAALYINNSSPAVTMDVYEIFLEHLDMQAPDNYAQIALTGIYTDTGGFVHKSPSYQKVFTVVPKLLEAGADLDALVSHLNQISPGAVTVMHELLTNTRHQDDFTYTFISDQTAKADNHQALVEASNLYRNNFLRSVAGRPWGFIVQHDVAAIQPDIYSVSFRAQTDTTDVSKIAKLLGGGGHKPAAGSKFKAPNVNEAVQKVLTAIEQSRSS